MTDRFVLSSALITGSAAWFGLGIGVGLLLAAVAWVHCFGWRLPHGIRQMQNDLDVLRMIVNNASDGFLIQNVDSRIEWANPAYAKMFGMDVSEIIGRSPLEYCLPPDVHVPPEEIANFRYDIEGNFDSELETRQNRRKNGELFWIQLSFAVVNPEQGDDAKVIAICRDVSEQMERHQALEQAKKEIEHRATHDYLTGLANRAALAMFLDNAVAQLRRSGRPFAILHIDLDKFKPINDDHGHAAGDAVLVEVGKRLVSALREQDLAARVGGDEFAMVCLDVSQHSDAKVVGNKVMAALTKPFTFEGINLEIGASIGISIACPMNRNVDKETLVRTADQALYNVKRKGRGGVAIFDNCEPAKNPLDPMIVS